MNIEVTILIAALVLSAFFKGMEVAFISANKMGLEVDRQKGTFASNLLKIFSSNSEQYTATMMVGFTISLITYGLAFIKIADPLLSPLITVGAIRLIILAIVATLMFLIVAEFIPHTLFRINPNGILKAFSLPLLLFYIILYPIALFCMFLSKVIIKIVFNKKVLPENDKNVFSMIDLDNFITNSFNHEGNENVEEETEIELFKNALDFSKLKVRDCMIPRAELEAIEISSTIGELNEKFIATGYSKILVYSDNIDNIVGYVHSSQMFKNPSSIKNVLTTISFVPEAMMANKLLRTFNLKHKSIAIVVDEFGGVSGMVTIEDVLEEIFGEIEDEHDTDDLVVKNTKENEWILSARNEISLLNTKYHFDLPEGDEYDTIAGLLLQYYEDIPKINSLITIQNFEFRVLKATKTRIELVWMKIVPIN